MRYPGCICHVSAANISAAGDHGLRKGDLGDGLAQLEPEAVILPNFEDGRARAQRWTLEEEEPDPVGVHHAKGTTCRCDIFSSLTLRLHGLLLVDKQWQGMYVLLVLSVPSKLTLLLGGCCCVLMVAGVPSVSGR